ncbi:TetR family transcriptional regulator [Leifsonia sp. A12D58]|uniref:TetR family transcriptional regulator n=1 Tax=Leifsonia sp. A12D58 TaxID=3397674 RepID=UPI0039E02643
MRSDGQATRERILVAARAEFAAHGLAGARVDRIAASANASKERLYAYFGDKTALFGAVIEVNTDEVKAAVPLDTSDLPGFVGRVYDHATNHPEHLRMLDWARLEGQFVADATHVPPWRSPEQIAAIEDAQRAGTIDADWNPQDLLTLLLSLATAWVHAPVDIDELNGRLNAETVARRRAAAVDAARKLLS